MPPDPVDADGATPLYYAACRGYVNVITALVGAGANPNVVTHSGGTPIHCATRIKNSAIMAKTLRALVVAGADINAQDKNGYTPLHVAVLENDFEKVVHVLSYGPNVNR